jgi:serine/threonine protein kinase
MSTNPPPTTLRARWSQADLLRMLQQREWNSPPLCLKAGDTEVQRVWRIDKEGKGKACIEKHYTRNLSANQQREADFLFKCSRVNLLKSHMAYLVETRASATMQSEVFYTEWGGLDLKQWQSLLGASNPLTNSIPGMLFLIKKILEACYQFHRLGLVHNDLHCANLILDYDYDPQQHSVTLKPDQIRLIDFEFSLRPRADQPAPKAQNGQAGRHDSQIEVRTATEWRQANGNPILLEPNLHSPHVCAAAGEMALSKRCKILHRRYRSSADGRFQYLPEVFANLEKVDFGVDFFTLGHSLKTMIHKAARYWDDAHTQQWEDAHDFLLGLPTMLQEWDQAVPQQVREVPHQDLINEIQRFLGSWNADGKLTVRLPGKPLPPTKPKRRFWLGAGGIAIAGLAALAAMYYPRAPEEFTATITPEPISSLGKISLDPDDKLTLTWQQRSFRAKPNQKGEFSFTELPAQARGQNVAVKLESASPIYEAATKSVIASETGAPLLLRHKTRLLEVVVTENGTPERITNARVLVDAQNNGPTETRIGENSAYLLSIRADQTAEMRVTASADGYCPETMRHMPIKSDNIQTIRIALKKMSVVAPPCP